MSSPKRIWLAGAWLPLLLAASAAANADSGRAASSCGQLARYGEGGVELVSVQAAGVGCSTARRVLERHVHGEFSAAWDCHSAGTQAVCTRGATTASYTAANHVRSCGNVEFASNSGDGAFQIVAKRARCYVARRVARGSREHGANPYVSHTYRRHGYTCRGWYDDGHTMPRVLYTCRRGSRTVAFTR